MIFSMEKEKKAGKMALFSKVITKKVKSTDMGCITGTMEVNIVVNGMKIR